MKLTKSKLKQLIKEVAEEELEIDSSEGADPEWPAHLGSGPWVTDVKQILAAAGSLYEDLPLEGKEAITDTFEWYAKRWRKQMREETDDTPSWMEDDDSDDDDEDELTKDIRNRSGGEWPPR